MGSQKTLITIVSPMAKLNKIKISSKYTSYDDFLANILRAAAMFFHLLLSEMKHWIFRALPLGVTFGGWCGGGGVEEAWSMSPN